MKGTSSRWKGLTPPGTGRRLPLRVEPPGCTYRSLPNPPTQTKRAPCHENLNF